MMKKDVSRQISGKWWWDLWTWWFLWMDDLRERIFQLEEWCVMILMCFSHNNIEISRKLKLGVFKMRSASATGKRRRTAKNNVKFYQEKTFISHNHEDGSVWHRKTWWRSCLQTPIRTNQRTRKCDDFSTLLIQTHWISAGIMIWFTTANGDFNKPYMAGDFQYEIIHLKSL